MGVKRTGIGSTVTTFDYSALVTPTQGTLVKATGSTTGGTRLLATALLVAPTGGTTGGTVAMENVTTGGTAVAVATIENNFSKIVLQNRNTRNDLAKVVLELNAVKTDVAAIIAALKSAALMSTV